MTRQVRAGHRRIRSAPQNRPRRLGRGAAPAPASGALNTAAAAGKASSSGDGCRASVTYHDKRILISADAG